MFDQILMKINGVLSTWETIKTNHNLTDEIIEEGNRILAEEKAKQ